MPIDTERMTLTELIQLHTELDAAMNRRFRRPQAMVFTDVVDSTAYFRHFGNVAGRALQQRHFDAASAHLAAHQGRLVDTAGDGALLCFPTADGAARTVTATLRDIEEKNATYAVEHQLSLRVGIHFGAVLTDGTMLSGDAVNVCSRIASAASPREVYLSTEAVQELSGVLRAQCLRLPAVALKGVAAPVDLHLLSWRERRVVPSLARLVECEAVLPLPPKDVISFGRLEHSDGAGGGPAGNDIVLRTPEPAGTARISRWHFELRRQPSGLVLRAVTDRPTVVGDKVLQKGEEVRVSAGTVVRVSDVLSVELLGDEAAASGGPSLIETSMK